MSRRAGLLAALGVVAAVAVALAVALAADDRRAPAATGRPIVYVAVGASESVGVGTTDPSTEAWPVVFIREALPPGSRFTNVAVSGSTVAQALTEQVPKAVAAAPDLVTVWLNVNDLRALVEPDVYAGQLRELVTALRRGGETTVLVANTPEIDQLPVLRSLPIPPAFVEARVDEYNRVIADVVDETGAVQVDLHGPSEDFEEAGRIAALTSGDGFHPNAEGHREVAQAFTEAYDDVGG